MGVAMPSESACSAQTAMLRLGVSRGEVKMAWLDHKSLRDQIADASRELKLARRDGSAEWIEKSAEALDALIDQIPRTAQPQGTAL